MNPNNYNTYGYPQFNVGSGWSSNNNFPMNNKLNMNQGQDFQSVGPPPPIGFVLPNANQSNNPPQYQISQPNIDYNQHTTPAANTGQNIPAYQTNSYNQSVPAPIYKNQTQRDINQNIYEKQKIPVQPEKPQISSEPHQKQHVNVSTNENKSEYQKGLDKLAELMNEDLTSEELKKLYKNPANN